MRVWIDMTASAHVLVFRPLIGILRRRGDEVEVTAREYAQTLQLLELHGIEADVIGRHGGRSRPRQAGPLLRPPHAPPRPAPRPGPRPAPPARSPRPPQDPRPPPGP